MFCYYSHPPGNPKNAMKVQLCQVETHQPAEIKHPAATLDLNTLPLEDARDHQSVQKVYLGANFQSGDEYRVMSLPVDKQSTSDSAEDSHQ